MGCEYFCPLCWGFDPRLIHNKTMTLFWWQIGVFFPLFSAVHFVLWGPARGQQHVLPASPSSRGALGGFSDGSWGVSGRKIPLGPLGSDWKKLVVLKDAESCFLFPHSPTPPCAAERVFYSTLNHKPAHSTLFLGGCFFCNSLNTHCLHSANFQSNNIKVRLQVRGPTKVLKTRPALHPASCETPPEPPPTPQPPPPPRGAASEDLGGRRRGGGKGAVWFSRHWHIAAKD